MKKIISLFVASAIFMFPLATYAAVNITLREVDTGSVSIGIDTETDTLEMVTLPISYSDGVEITDVTDGDITCSELSYTESQETSNTVVVSCTLDSATALDGILANITFNSTGDTPATFEVVESDELDLDTLTLGETVSLEQTSAGSTTEEVTTTEEDLPTTTETPTAEDLMVTTGETTETTTEGSLLGSITEYLPYILIAGSVILLISIVVILLGKKKDPKEPKMKKEKKGKKIEQTAPTPGTQPQNDRSLKDMVNNPESAPSQPRPVQEETSAPTPMSQTVSETPVQPAYTQPPQSNTPVVSTTTQEEDLQEILQRESSVPTAMGDNPPQEVPQTGAPMDTQQPTQGVPFSAGFAAPQQEGPENIMPEAPQPGIEAAQQVPPVTSIPEAETTNNMQQPNMSPNPQPTINNQINQINGGVIPTQQPTMETMAPQQPTQPGQQQIPPITLQQNQNTDNTPEEMPPVPPTM